MTTFQRFSARLWPWLRLGLFMTCLCAFSAWWWVRSASAHAEERALEMGQELAKLRDLVSGTTSLTLNGEPVTLTSASSDHSVTTLLDRFTASCANESGGMKQEIARMLEQGARLPKEITPDAFGVLRTQEEDVRGTAACFARQGAEGVRGMLARVAKLAETGKLGAMGELRYVFAKRAEGAAQTHVITVQANGDLPLEQMFPERGDAPGEDLFPNARPARSRRVLSAKLSTGKHHATIYESHDEADVALAGFEAPLQAQGFAPADLRVTHDVSPVPTRVYLKEDDIVLLLVDEREDANYVAAYRLPYGGFVRASFGG
jgi:hypothetical protein